MWCCEMNSQGGDDRRKVGKVDHGRMKGEIVVSDGRRRRMVDTYSEYRVVVATTEDVAQEGGFDVVRSSNLGDWWMKGWRPADYFRG